MKTTKEYLMFKNYMHNELGITKEDIKKWTEDSVIRTVDTKLDIYLDSKRFETLLLNRITTIINNDKIYDSFYQPQNFKNWFLGIVKNEIKKEIVDNINFNIDVNIKNKE
jgi:hypothetical protein